MNKKYAAETRDMRAQKKNRSALDHIRTSGPKLKQSRQSALGTQTSGGAGSLSQLKNLDTPIKINPSSGKVQLPQI